MTRRTVLFSGQVQGVGFRFKTHLIAQAYPVSGYVMNLADGRVEAVFEGESPEIDSLVAEVTRILDRHIRDAVVRDDEPTGEYKGFEIQYEPHPELPRRLGDHEYKDS